MYMDDLSKYPSLLVKQNYSMDWEYEEDVKKLQDKIDNWAGVNMANGTYGKMWDPLWSTERKRRVFLNGDRLGNIDVQMDLESLNTSVKVDMQVRQMIWMEKGLSIFIMRRFDFNDVLLQFNRVLVRMHLQNQKLFWFAYLKRISMSCWEWSKDSADSRFEKKDHSLRMRGDILGLRWRTFLHLFMNLWNFLAWMVLKAQSLNCEFPWKGD